MTYIGALKCCKNMLQETLQEQEDTLHQELKLQMDLNMKRLSL
jgi:hypothetical protein